MLNDVLEIHFEKWLKTTDLKEKSYFLVLDDDKLEDFFEKRKSLMNSKHLDYISRIKDGFYGYFEVLDVFENRLKIKNLIDGEIYEVVSKLKPVKYDLIISRVYKFKTEDYLLDELSIVYPYFYLKYIDLKGTPFNNYSKITNMQLEGKKCWDGFLYKTYVCIGEIIDFKKFEKFIKKVDSLGLLSKNEIVILLKGKVAESIRRMPISLNDEVISLELGTMSFYNNKVIFGFLNINLAKTFLELLGDLYRMEKFYLNESNDYKPLNLDDEFNNEFREHAIYEFYSAKKDYTEEEFKFYYNLEAHFKRINALNFFHIFEKNE